MLVVWCDQNFARNLCMWRREKHSVLGRPNLQWQKDIHLHAKIPEALRHLQSFRGLLNHHTRGLTQYFVLQATFSFQSLSLVHAWLSFIPAPCVLLFSAHLFFALPCMSKILKFLFVLEVDFSVQDPHLNASGIFAWRCISLCQWRFGLPKTECFFLLQIYCWFIFSLYSFMSQWLYHHPSHWEYIASFLPCHFPFLLFTMRRLLRFDYPLIERWYIGQFTFAIILRLYHNNDILSPI